MKTARTNVAELEEETFFTSNSMELDHSGQFEDVVLYTGSIGSIIIDGIQKMSNYTQEDIKYLYEDQNYI